MRPSVRSVLAAFVIAAALCSRVSAQPAPVPDRWELRHQQFLLEHRDESGVPRADLLREGLRDASRLPILPRYPLTSQAAPFSLIAPAAPLGGAWRQIGPAPLRIEPTGPPCVTATDHYPECYQGSASPGSGDSGEVVDIAIDPEGSTDQYLFIATNDGGVWKSGDEGMSWVPETDDESKFLTPNPDVTLSMGAIALDPDDSEVMYAGTGNLFDGGFLFSKGVGVYKSVDAGDTWSVLNPGGILTQNPTSVPFSGAPDVFRRSGGIVSRIVVTPSTVPNAPNVVLVGTDRGLFRSTDGGGTFTLVPLDPKRCSVTRATSCTSPTDCPVGEACTPVVGFITDLDVDTVTPTIVYASVADYTCATTTTRTCQQDADCPGGEQCFRSVVALRGRGVFRSTDSGATFPANLFNNPGAPTTPGFIVFAQSTLPDNRTMYANVQRFRKFADPNAPNADLYRSVDLGAHWTAMNAVNAATANATEISQLDGGCQCGYDQTLGVDPQDAQRVYIGYQELYVSTDGGATFGAKIPLAAPTPAPPLQPYRVNSITASQVHWDHHALVFSPRMHWKSKPTRIYIGTDGGIARSDDGGTTWRNVNETIATNLFKHIDIGRNSVENNKYTYGGTQDTGTDERRPEFPALDWREGWDGDGSGVAVDPTIPTRAYGASNGNYIRTQDGGTTWLGATTPPPGVWRYAVDPNDGNNVFVIDSPNPAANAGFIPGTNLYRSTDRGVNFTAMPIWTFGAAARAVANVKINSNVLWFGLDNGTAEHTEDALATAPTFTNHPVNGRPANQPITGVAIDPGNINNVVAVYPGFTGKHVFRTMDDGMSWDDITGTGPMKLPDLPLHAVVIDPGTTPHSIIVASDKRVFVSLNGLDKNVMPKDVTWSILGTDLPAVDVESLALDASCSPEILRAGTYGRSVFELGGAATRTCQPLKHFECYEMPRELFTKTSVTLKDRFGASTVDVIRRKRLCNPADKNGEDPTAPFEPDHLAGYVIRQTSPTFTPMTGVTVVNQFGTVTVDLAKPDYMLVPAAKDLDAPPGPLGGRRCRGGGTNDGALCAASSECPGGNCQVLALHCRGGANDGFACAQQSECPGGSCGVDHFKCYRVRSAKTRVSDLTLTDEFGTLGYDVKRPLRFCVAADKNGESPGAETHPAELLCYKGVQTSLPKFRGVDPVFIEDQFGAAEASVDHLREFCVPPLPPTPTPTVTPTPTPSVSATPTAQALTPTPTPTATPQVMCCEVPFEGLTSGDSGGNESTVCLDAAMPNVQTKCDAASGMLLPGACDAPSEGCVTTTAAPGDLCCECTVDKPPFPDTTACFPLVVANKGDCNTTGTPAQCKIYEGVPCGAVSEKCGGP